MNLSEYDGKYVSIKTESGSMFSGLADYANSEFLVREYGGEEDGIFIEDFLIYRSQIASIKEIEVHGTVELRTENLILRRYRPEDAGQLHERFGRDPRMYRYSGWNPYATVEMAQETVHRFIESYDVSYESTHSYSWVMDVDDVIVGTIGAYDYKDDRIEVGFSVDRDWQGRGIATEALRKVLEYLTENENISIVTAWCAEENIGSRRVLEKSGMQFVKSEKSGIVLGENNFDKLIYEYRRGVER